MSVLSASPETIHWGYFDATQPPVRTVKSGERLTIETVSGAPAHLPPPGFHVPPELLAIHKAFPGAPFGPHILTGPVAVDGAEPGDTLEVRIEAVKLRQDWGHNFHKPLGGTLPDDFTDYRLIHIALDETTMTGRLPFGVTVPLNPFFGVMGTAPPPAWGRCTSIIPRAFGGNMDNRDLVAGTTLFLPVFVPGALFSCGDGHAAQGDGEVNVTAIETALEGTFTFILHKNQPLEAPRAETPTHLITCAFDPDLDRCAEVALRRMITLLVDTTTLTRADAYALLSIAGDLRITQTVNQHKGVHCTLAKSLIAGLQR